MTATVAPPVDAGTATGAATTQQDDPPRTTRPVPATLAPWHDPNARRGWLATLVVAALAVLTRFWALGFPPG